MAELLRGEGLGVADAWARRLREDFPILTNPAPAGLPPLVYLDSAATSQKPRAVIDAIVHYYEAANANVHRSIHRLGEEATAALEAARRSAAAFVGAASSQELIFTRGTTEAFNLLASSLGAGFGPGDEVILSLMEHHANLVPWQMAARARGFALRFVPLDDAGDLDLGALEALLGPRTRLVSLTQVSNLLGTVNPVSHIADMVHAAGALLAVDAAQSLPHMRVKVGELGTDFLAFSGHKAFGPMGIGCLYGRAELLEAMPPWQGGGEMISQVSLEGFSTNELPWKFEAGTPNVEGALGLEAGLAYLSGLGLEKVEAWTTSLAAYAAERLGAIPGVVIHGSPGLRAGLFPFTLEGVHAHDLAAFLDRRGIAVRAGKHCAHPLSDSLGLASSLRASFHAYSTLADVQALVEGMAEAASRGGKL